MLRGRSGERFIAGTPSTARVHSFDSAVAAPPRMPPWLLPLKNASPVAITGFDGEPARNAALVTNPLGLFITRARNCMLRKLCCSRSARVGKPFRFKRMLATFGTSSLDIPIHGVAHITELNALACG